MIIQRLSATNVLKYAQLDLADLPATGLIGISGQNESGKSSIGEALCFALFGRTFSLGGEEIDKLVRWGENHCQVTLDFLHGEHGYSLYRFLDRDGNHSARLTRSDQPERPTARGVDAVADALYGLLGYEFDEFIESFYLAQREITTPHPHSHAVKIMAGVAPLQFVAAEMEEEVTDEQETARATEEELAAARRELEALGLDPDQAGVLDTARAEHASRIVEIDNAVVEIHDAAAAYRADQPIYRAARGASGRWGAFRTLLLLLAVLAGLLWGLLEYGPGVGQVAPYASQAQQLLNDQLPQLQPGVAQRWVGYAAAGLGGLGILVWIAAAGAAGKARRHTEAGVRLAESVAAARSLDAGPHVDPIDSELADAVDSGELLDLDGEGGLSPLPARPSDARADELCADAVGMAAELASVEAYIAEEEAWLRAVAEGLSAKVRELDQAIGDENARVRHAETLQEVAAGLEGKLGGIQAQVAQRELAIELLDGASQQLSQRFNRDIRDLVSKSLPAFTEGRYEHLQIDESLGVRVFSSEKRDSMHLDEVSSGTQRQIMLALRLALSEKLLSRTTVGSQFTFLDEPFAFFDESRTRRALETLTNVDGPLQQLWIVAQSFPGESEGSFALRIECDRDSVELSNA
jgi:exonuclease SbcC